MQQIFFLVTLICCINIFAQKKDTNHLLTNSTIQIETIEAIDSMYNFNFEIAEKQYRWLKQQYPNHPLPYFLLALNEWWKVLPNELVETYDQTFLGYLDQTIEKSKALLKLDKNNLEASYFLSASYGFKARLYGERGNYTKAATFSKKALNHLMKCKEFNAELHPEFLFGVGLYDYYREWVPENRKSLKMIMFLFPKGDKEKGIQTLEDVATESFYTRVEAMRYLIKIYSSYESQHDKAWDYIKYLNNLYPNNAFFLRTKAKVAYKSRRSTECMNICNDALHRIEKGDVGFENETGRVCSFYLGQNAYNKGDTLSAQQYLLKCLIFTENGPAYSKGYTRRAVDYLAKIAIHQKKEALAYTYYKKIIELSDNNYSDLKKRAKKYIKKNKKRFEQNAEPIPYP